MPHRCWSHWEGRGWCTWETRWTGDSTFPWSASCIHSSLKIPNPWRPSIPSQFSLPRFGAWNSSLCFAHLCSLLSLVTCISVGLQCNYRVLLGTVSPRVELRQCSHPSGIGPPHKERFHQQARQTLEGSRYSGVQHIPLVGQRRYEQDPVSSRHNSAVKYGDTRMHYYAWKFSVLICSSPVIEWVVWLPSVFVYRRGSFEDEEKDVVELPADDAYRIAMKSLVRWVEKNMDPNKTRVFFTSMSPVHGK